MLHGLHGVSGKSPKDEAEFCQVPPVVAVLVKQLLLPLLEQLDGLLALPLQVLDEDFEVLVRVQQVQLVLQMRLQPVVLSQLHCAVLQQIRCITQQYWDPYCRATFV